MILFWYLSLVKVKSFVFNKVIISLFFCGFSLDTSIGLPPGFLSLSPQKFVFSPAWFNSWTPEKNTKRNIKSIYCSSVIISGWLWSSERERERTRDQTAQDCRHPGYDLERGGRKEKGRGLEREVGGDTKMEEWKQWGRGRDLEGERGLRSVSRQPGGRWEKD